MKIGIIGPSYPFKGGIAHYMTLLFKELADHHDVQFFSFKRQYPRWLYPGKTDKDESKSAIRDERIEQVLDSMNPLTWFAVFGRIKKHGPDLVIIPWWVAFWAPHFWFISKLIKNNKKTKILFICHNVVEHESNFFTKFLTRIVLKQGDYFIVHSQDDMDNLKNIIPSANVIKSHHPTYEVFKTQEIEKSNAQKTLGLEGNVILFFGFVRAYKGLIYLIESLPIVLKEIKVTLLIVGEFWKDKKTYIDKIEELGVAGNIKIIDKYIANDQISGYFSASDVVVLPYTSATGSGIVQTAFGCKRPVITTKVGSLSDVVRNGETGFLVSPEDAEALAAAVVRFYKEGKEQEFTANINKYKDEFSWTCMRGKIESFSKHKEV